LALIAHAQGERLVAGALVVHFIAVLRERNAVLAFLVWLMCSLALDFLFDEVVFKTHMLYKFIIVFAACTIHTLFIRPMFANGLHIVNIIKAVDAPARRSVVAVTLLDFFGRFRWVLYMLFGWRAR
jgi:hypothetical protein